MSDVNNIVIGGRLVEDPKIKEVNDNTVCKMRIASTKVLGKQKVEKSVFIDIDAWNGLGKICNQYLKKGSKIYVTGSLRQDNWESEGVKKSKIFVEASDIEFAGNSSSNTKSEYKSKPTQKVNENKSVESSSSFEDDSDLPF